MRLVVDTNIIISAMIRDSTVRRILLHPMFEFYIPEFVFVEIEKNSHEIIEKSGFTDEEYYTMLNTIMSRIIVVPKDEFEEYVPKAKRIMKMINEEDTSFLALAMSFRNDGIWTDDEHFQRQNTVKVWKTRDLVELL